MMTSQQIRQTFLDFFNKKGHKIVPSAPIVNKDDPTLMFINAGMVPFKDYFLGNKKASHTRIANTQKCLRVSGKHNDLEEVGRDSYHQTLFEMLGNWSFGDYFKEEAIEWAWELLTQVYELPKDRIYVSVFGGDESEGLQRDKEAANFWEKWIDADRILDFDKKDNFWEMGEQGPCGPCSEIHIDLRSDAQRAAKDGRLLVNQDDPLVIEIWNLVFIQYNRKADRSLVELPTKHIDTGMGLERLVMALQAKSSNYDTDIFAHIIKEVEQISGKKYTSSYKTDAMSDIAMRVVADHLRAVSFAIADGLSPSNTGAAYVIRRILRRAVRYYYSFLDVKTPFLHTLVPALAKQFESVFPELIKQEGFIQKVILAEEKSFLRTLEGGLRRIESLKLDNNTLDGKLAFELNDTFGFPFDLTCLIAEEKGWKIDNKGYQKALQEQKKRSKDDAAKEVGDWMVLIDESDTTFLGWDNLIINDAKVVKYRIIEVKKKKQFQLVLNKTPFYAEGGGQVGDVGYLDFEDERIEVLDTKKENDLVINFVKKLPTNITSNVKAVVNATKRHLTENNHTATHILHAALWQVLGNHVQQKGSLVRSDYLRFDFSHFQKLSSEELSKIEQIVNQKIRQNIALEEARDMPIEEAQKSGARMLFGEKYGEKVRMITFDPEYSRELCGGCHVSSTGKIGYFKILSESSISSGVRRIEAVTADGAERYINQHLNTLTEVQNLFKNPKNVVQTISNLQDENKQLKKEIENLQLEQANALKIELISKVEQIGDVQFVGAKVSINDSKALKNLAYQIKNELDNSIIVFGATINGKPQLMVTVHESLTDSFHAGKMIRELAKEIKGGGGGQAFFATAGGKDASGLESAIEKAREILAS